MLILRHKLNHKNVIDIPPGSEGGTIEITLLAVEHKRTKIRVDAPQFMRVSRVEPEVEHEHSA